jgi:GNAT superfamily N-acetyltransferase
MAAWIIGRLGRTHDRSAFDCGQLVLNDWLKNRASQFDRRDLSRTFVATRPGDSQVLGYYAISTHRVLYEVLPPQESKGLPRLDVPVVLLGRLAVDRSAQRQGLGSLLLVDALRRALQISEHIGIRSVEVDALDEAARQFYLQFGFRPLRDDPQHLLMPMHEIRKLNLDPLP